MTNAHRVARGFELLIGDRCSRSFWAAPVTFTSFCVRAKAWLVSCKTPAGWISVDSALRRSGLSIVKRVSPAFTSSPSFAKTAIILPGFGANTWTDLSSLKSMLPTEVFSIRKSRYATGAVLIAAARF
jgi:hypothetical protein